MIDATKMELSRFVEDERLYTFVKNYLLDQKFELNIASMDNSQLGERYRANEEAKRIIRKAFSDMLQYKNNNKGESEKNEAT